MKYFAYGSNMSFARLQARVPSARSLGCYALRQHDLRFHKSGLETRWRTFDQIMFSSAFLGGSEWELDERQTQILQIPSFEEGFSLPRNIFDHNPVVSVIHKEPRHG